MTRNMCALNSCTSGLFLPPALSKSSFWKEGLLETESLPLKLFIVLAFSLHSRLLIVSSGIHGMKLRML